MSQEVFKTQAQVGKPLFVIGKNAAWKRQGQNRHYGVPPPSADVATEVEDFLGAVGSIRATSSPASRPSIAAQISFSESTLMASCLKLSPFLTKTVCVPSF